MPIQITIEGANALEVKQLVHDLAGTLSGMAPEQIPPQTIVSTINTPAAPAVPQEPEVEPINNDEPETDDSDASDEPIPTDVELRAVAAEIGKKGPEAKKKIKELLGKYGVPNITAVPDSKRIAFKRELEALA